MEVATTSLIASSWCWRPLSEVAEVIAGQSPPSSTYNKDGIGLPFFQGKAEFGRDIPLASKWCARPTKVAKDGDILISIRAPVGPTNYAPFDCGIGRGLAAIRPGPQIESRWLRYWLQHSQQALVALATGTTFEAITGGILRRHKCPVPPIDSQRRIVARIDELFAEIDDGEDELRRARQELGTYRRSLLKSAVTGELTADWRTSNVPDETGEQLLTRILDERHARWAADPKNKGRRYSTPRPPKTEGLPKLPPTWTWATIHQLTDFLTSGSRGWSQYYSSSGATFIRAQNIKTDRLNLGDVAYVHLPAKAEGTRTRVRVGDILVTITGANVTKAAIVKSDVGEAYVSQHVALLRLHPAISSHFCWLWLVTPAGGRRQLERAAYGAGKPGLNLANILDVTIPLPPLSEQEQVFALAQTALNDVADLVGDMPRLIDVRELRQSILAAAFHGELVR